MGSRRTGSLIGVGAAALTAIASAVAAGPANADPNAHSPRTVVVAPAAASAAGSSSSCRNPDYTSIQDAIKGVARGGTVVVCKGTYPGMVNVDRPITLAGRRGATIDASGDAYGIGVSASWSTITGMTVKDAGPLDPQNGKLADGIVTIALGASGPVAADHVRIVHNVVRGNLGSGIDINSSSYSIATDNVAKDNGVGINLADDINRPANHNKVLFNVTDRNFGGCGIALADHTGAGVSHNVVAFNVADDNGLATATAPDASAGSGVILASPIPGGIVTDNSIYGNEFHGNGHGGVVVHAHAPNSDFSGNSVTYNRIGRNNLRTDENDLKSTGVYLGSAGPLTIEVSHNVIGPDYYGIFTSGQVTLHAHHNSFVRVNHRIGSAPTF